VPSTCAPSDSHLRRRRRAPQSKVKRLHLDNLSAAHLLVDVVAMLRRAVNELTVLEWKLDTNDYEPCPLLA